MGAERLGRVIGTGDGDHGTGRCEEPGAGTVTEGRRPSGVAEGRGTQRNVRAEEGSAGWSCHLKDGGEEPPLKQFRFGGGPEQPRPTRKAGTRCERSQMAGRVSLPHPGGLSVSHEGAGHSGSTIAYTG